MNNSEWSLGYTQVKLGLCNPWSSGEEHGHPFKFGFASILAHTWSMIYVTLHRKCQGLLGATWFRIPILPLLLWFCQNPADFSSSWHVYSSFSIRAQILEECWSILSIRWPSNSKRNKQCFPILSLHFIWPLFIIEQQTATVLITRTLSFPPLLCSVLPLTSHSNLWLVIVVNKMWF